MLEQSYRIFQSIINLLITKMYPNLNREIAESKLPRNLAKQIRLYRQIVAGEKTIDSDTPMCVMYNLLIREATTVEMVDQIMRLVPEKDIRYFVHICAKIDVMRFRAACEVARERDYWVVIKPKGTYFIPDRGYMAPAVAKYCLRKDYCDPKHPTIQRSIARDVDLFDYFTNKKYPIVLDIFLNELTLVDNLEIFSQISIRASTTEILSYVLTNDAITIYRHMAPEITDIIRAMCIFGCAKGHRSFSESRCYAEIFGQHVSEPPMPEQRLEKPRAVSITFAVEEVVRLGYPFEIIAEALHVVRLNRVATIYVNTTKCKLTMEQVIEFVPLFPVSDILGVEMKLLLKQAQRFPKIALKRLPNVAKNFEIVPDGDYSLLLKAASCNAVDWFTLHFAINPLIPTKVLTTAIQHDSEGCVEVIFDEIKSRGLKLELGTSLIKANSRKYTFLAIQYGIYYITEPDYRKAVEKGAKRFLRGCREGGMNVGPPSTSDDGD